MNILFIKSQYRCVDIDLYIKTCPLAVMASTINKDFIGPRWWHPRSHNLSYITAQSSPSSSFNLLLCHCPQLAHAAQVKCNIGLAFADMTDHDEVIKWKHFPRYWPFLRGIPPQRPVARSFDVFFDLRLNKRLSKQSWGWWFETPSRSLWRHCNEGRASTPVAIVMISLVPENSFCN